MIPAKQGLSIRVECPSRAEHVELPVLIQVGDTRLPVPGILDRPPREHLTIGLQHRERSIGEHQLVPGDTIQIRERDRATVPKYSCLEAGFLATGRGVVGHDCPPAATECRNDFELTVTVHVSDAWRGGLA